jgi:hypothetical protein
MAARQAKIDILPLAEREKQEERAQQQFCQNSGQCVAGFAWYRRRGGYQCYGGTHLVTDKLLAEGKRGFYFNKFDYGKVWEGPVYQEKEKPREKKRGLLQSLLLGGRS